MENLGLSDSEVSQLNDFEGFLSYKVTWPIRKLLNAEQRTIALFTGNQFGKTAAVAYSYVLRILGLHPIAKKNITYWRCSGCSEEYGVTQIKDRVLKKVAGEEVEVPLCACGSELLKHKRGSKVLRFCSETLPGQSSNVSIEGTSAEVKNTQYPEFKKWLPKYLIKKDITFRSPTMILIDPLGGDDIIVEFVSYNQSVQSTAGTQRVSVWYDEEPPKDFREEQQPRLLAEDGDEVFTLTPANHISWMYDEIYEKAAVFYKTEAICKFLESDLGRKVEQVEYVNSGKDIAVIQAATDDNPTLSSTAIEAILGAIDDPDIYAIRRYGLFKQVSGRVFKDFEFKTHFISAKKWFENGIPHNWLHARGIDYHPQTPWAVGAISISPTNECFVWYEYNPSPEKRIIEEIAETICIGTEGYVFNLELIDPLSEAHKKLDNNRKMLSVRGELNNAFYKLRKEGVSTSAGAWQTWDTKGERGRDEIRKRLKNSLVVKRPFNNKVIDKNGNEIYLPTLWILDTCPLAAKSMRQWRWEEHASSRASVSKDEKNTPEQKWSHFNMVWEAIFKHPSFKPRARATVVERIKKSYFRGRA